MQITVLAGETAEDARSLYEWLVAEGDLRGRVQLRCSPPGPDTLGTLPDMLAVFVTPGLPAALVGAVIAWLRYRTADVTCTFVRPDGTRIEISAKRVKSADLVRTQELVDRLSRELTAGSAASPDGPGRIGSSGTE